MLYKLLLVLPVIAVDFLRVQYNVSSRLI